MVEIVFYYIGPNNWQEFTSHLFGAKQEITNLLIGPNICQKIKSHLISPNIWRKNINIYGNIFINHLVSKKQMTVKTINRLICEWAHGLEWS